MTDRARSTIAAAVVVLYATAYAAFCYALHVAGHRPSMPSPLIGADRQYLVQAVLLVPATLLIWPLFAGAAHAVARALGGTATFRRAWVALGPAWAIPALTLLVLPDVLVYVFLGFEHLAAAARVIGPVALVATAITTTAVLRRIHRLSSPRALAAAFAGLVVLALVHGPWLR